MKKVKNLIVTGGGSGGHVIPATTVLARIRAINPTINIICVGGINGIEKNIFSSLGYSYHEIYTGKLRRYLSFENLKDMFKLFLGVFQAFKFLLKFKRQETIIFATGGFVIVPVVFAGWIRGIDIIIHEQTTRVGLANKIAAIFSKKVLVSFSDSLPFFPKEKTIHSGYPLREHIFGPQKPIIIKGVEIDKIDRPVLFLTGGGNGSKLLNETLESLRGDIENDYFIIHQCGKKFYDYYLNQENNNYKVFDFIGDEMIDILKKADVVISRSGAGTVVELMALGKPSIFIPLKIAQKNEQYFNAMAAHEKLGSIIIQEDDLSEDILKRAISNIQTIPKGVRVEKNPTDEIVKIILGN